MNKKRLVSAWLILQLMFVVAIFWYADWKYQLPTPVPENFVPVRTGTKINLSLQIPDSGGKPVFVHFYNPQCPCSRFNKKHFQALVRQYRQQVHFVVVVLSDEPYSVETIQSKIGLDIPVLFDQAIAGKCGVYATPQAVLLDRDQRLYYRGNYNASRYCSEEKTAYAKLALDGMLESESLPVWSVQAVKSYGCTIPVCKN